MNTVSTAIKLNKRIPELDGIRGIAILLVLFWHYIICKMAVDYSSPLANIKVFFGLTWSGVDLFFVLSGFLIGGILLDNKNSSNYFQTFYIRRFCRIFPLYYFWLILFISLTYFFPLLKQHTLFFKPYPLEYYFTYTQNFIMAHYGNFGSHWLGITWSLALEEQFYICLPFLIYLTPRKYILKLLIFLIILAPILRISLFYSSTRYGFYSLVSMPCRMDSLLLGVLGAYIYRDEKLKNIIIINTKWIYLCISVLFCFLISLTFKVKSMSFGLSNLISWEMTLYGFLIIALFYFGVLLISITEKKGPITWITRNIYLQKLGIISYGVYIYHQGISGLIQILFKDKQIFIIYGIDIVVTLIALILTLIISHLSWTYVEKKIVQWGHQFNYKEKQDKYYQKWRIN